MSSSGFEFYSDRLSSLRVSKRRAGGHVTIARFVPRRHEVPVSSDKCSFDMPRHDGFVPTSHLPSSINDAPVCGFADVSDLL